MEKQPIKVYSLGEFLDLLETRGFLKETKSFEILSEYKTHCESMVSDMQQRQRYSTLKEFKEAFDADIALLKAPFLLNDIPFAFSTANYQPLGELIGEFVKTIALFGLPFKVIGQDIALHILFLSYKAKTSESIGVCGKIAFPSFLAFNEEQQRNFIEYPVAFFEFHDIN